MPCILAMATCMTAAFAPVRTTHRRPTQLHYLIPEEASSATARTAFFIWFFGASGGAGLARSAFPRMYDQVRQIRSYKDQPMAEGPRLGISTLFTGYPEDIAVAEIEAIVNSKLSVEQIVTAYPVENNFLSAKGYLTYDAFCQAHPNSNALAVRAVFDTFAQSTNVVSPDVAEGLLDLYRNDVYALNGKLLASKVQGYAAIFFLLGLLGLADVVAFGHAYQGWFPTWPGGESYAAFMNPDTGLQTIPQYWNIGN